MVVKPPDLSELFLAYRQAKSFVFFERRGVGLIAFAKFEDNLQANLEILQQKLADSSDWFNDVEMGETWVVPKKLRPGLPGGDHVINIGDDVVSRALDIQVRLQPSPELAIVEVLYLWKFGPVLESLISPSSLGYRLEVRNGKIDRYRRWLFQYWPDRYQEFRLMPIDAARHHLRKGQERVLIISADLASFYDTVEPSFLMVRPFIETLGASRALSVKEISEYRRQTKSLLRFYEKFRGSASAKTGLTWNTGVPIGAITSRVVANIALATLDRLVELNASTISYRRYVDDVVIVAKPGAESNLRDILSSFLPINKRASTQGDDRLSLDTRRLKRSRSSFYLQLSKVKIHQLSGAAGLEFVEAIASDFSRIVSESRAFIDESILVEQGARHLIRTKSGEGSSLRVLREADRTRLEKMELSTSLRSLERVSSLVTPDEARQVIRGHLEDICRVLNSEAHWVENLDTALRLLKLAVSIKDWESVAQLNTTMDSRWGTIDALKQYVTKMFHCDRLVESSSAWVWLRNFLHERRLEAVCTCIPSTLTSGEMKIGFPTKLAIRTSHLGQRGVLERAELLALSDLRARDQEEDNFKTKRVVEDSREEYLGKELESRFLLISRFIQLCAKQPSASWKMNPSRLFICTRPPSYFDVARRYFIKSEHEGFEEGNFDDLLDLVNAIRGTSYRDSLGTVVDQYTVRIRSNSSGNPGVPDPRLILGNLVNTEKEWLAAASRNRSTGEVQPSLSMARLIGLSKLVEQSSLIAREKTVDGLRRPTLLVLPELAVPRRWFRSVADYVVRNGKFALVTGLEYGHRPKSPFVANQVFAVLPGPFASVATLAWTKRLPAREEQIRLQGLVPPIQFESFSGCSAPRTVVQSTWGNLSVLICSELIEARRIADLLGRVDIVLCPSWNQDTASYDHLIQTAGLQLHCVVAISNNGTYSDCRAWAPYVERWRRDLCRLVNRGANEVISVVVPLASLRKFRACKPFDQGSIINPPQKSEKKAEWRPLPPDWPVPE